MTLYDYLKTSPQDWDTYDTEYDVCVTIGHVYEDDEDDEEGWYSDFRKFYINIMKKVNVISQEEDCLIINWSDLIKNNMKKFRAFSKENWFKHRQFENDEDEFVYQWIKEIHLYIAGYVSDNFYNKLVDFVSTLE